MKANLHNSLVSIAKKLVHYTKQTGEGFDPGTIHKLRTGFKEFRALLRWQHAGKKEYGGFKKIYKQAGAIRNIQVAQKILKEESFTSAAFNDWLMSRLARLKKEWNSTNHKKPAKQLLSGTKELKITYSKHKSFFEKNKKKIREVINNAAIADNSIHDCRKAMKDIQYVGDYCAKKKITIALIKKIPVQKLKTIAERVGAYNDQCMLINLMENFTVAKTVSVTQANMLDTWQKKRAIARKEIISRISHLKW
jgi:CHAD domain-containing protein